MSNMYGKPSYVAPDRKPDFAIRSVEFERVANAKYWIVNITNENTYNILYRYESNPFFPPHICASIEVLNGKGIYRFDYTKNAITLKDEQLSRISLKIREYINNEFEKEVLA